MSLNQNRFLSSSTGFMIRRRHNMGDRSQALGGSSQTLGGRGRVFYIPEEISFSVDNRAPADDESESDVEGLEECILPECLVCSLPYDENCSDRNPRNLNCGHTFCTGCLKTLLHKSSPSICCPTCRKSTQVLGCSVDNLSKNFALIHWVRVLDEPRQKISQTVVPNVATPQLQKCPEHNDYLRTYCLKDGKLICSSCELYGPHKGHPTRFLNEAALEEREKLNTLNPEVLKMKQMMERALHKVDGMCKEVQACGGKMEDEVDDFFQKIMDVIEENKKKVKIDIKMRTQLRVKALMEQAITFRECVEKADSVYKKTESLLGKDDYAVLSEAMLTLEQIECIFTNPPSPSPCARSDLKCVFPPDTLEEICLALGRSGVVIPDVVTIDSSKIYVKAFHDGFRISWEEQNFVDNPAISYHLQMAKGDESYTIMYRGSANKYTWKSDLERDVPYKFRVQVRTTEGVGNWSEPKEAWKTEPSYHWHAKWRNVKVELSPNKLEAAWLGGSSSHWATFAVDELFEGTGQYYTEIEILNLGKSKLKEKLVIGVISCSKTRANLIEWQDRKNHLGEWDIPSWSFLLTSGLLKSHTITDEGIPYGKDLMIQADDRIGVLVDMLEKKLTYFCNGTDLGMAFDDLNGQSFLLAVSIRDKVRVRLRFPPPPYSKRTIKLVKLKSTHSEF